MPEENLKLIAGLGNPGGTYASTRHNIGFMVIDKLSESFSIPLNKSDYGTQWGRGTIEGRKVILAKPQKYMNLSGPPLQRLKQYFRILCKDMLIVHDDIDLAFGRLKIKEKGGHGGHKGISSIISAVGSRDFSRLRIGVGRPEERIPVADYVLGKFSSEERSSLDQILDRAKDAATSILCHGAAQSMNRFNSKS